MSQKDDYLKDECPLLRERDAELVGFAPVERWDEAGEVRLNFVHGAMAFARTVIVMGMPMLLPIVETTPSVLHMEMYTIVNRKLDTLAFDLAVFSTGKVTPFLFGRDTYASLKALRNAPYAAFSHVMAAKYAGLGTIGVSHCC
jgi:epoxyqueuosine reductase QueG